MPKPRHSPRPRPKTRAEFFAREKEVWGELAATWRGLPEEALTRPGACGPEWSVKDVMNHIAAWLQVTSRMIPEWREGRKATLGHGTDKFNAVQHEQDKSRSLAASKRRLDRARREALALIAAPPRRTCSTWKAAGGGGSSTTPTGTTASTFTNWPGFGSGGNAEGR